MTRIARLARSFQPDVIDLNTLDRPPADGSVQVCPLETLTQLAPLFTPVAHVARSLPPGTPPPFVTTPDAEAMVALVRRHPASADQLATHAGHSLEATLATLKALAAQQRIQLVKRDGIWFASP